MKKYKLEEICSLITDGTHQTPVYCEDGGYIFLSSKDVTTRKINWENTKFVPEELHEKLYKRLKPQVDDILLAKNGTTGVAAIVDRDIVFDIYVSLALLRPKDIVYPKYLLYFINSPIAKRQFNKGLKGIGVPNLHLSTIRKTELKLPDINKQKEISNIFDVITAIIEKRQKQLEDFDTLIKSRFVEMFGDPCDNGKGWDIIVLDDVSPIVTYGLTRRPKFIDEGIDVISAREIRSGIVDFESSPKISEEDFENLSVKAKPVKNEILFSKTGSIGHCALIETDKRFAVTQNAARIALNLEVINPIWMLTYLRTSYIQDWCNRHAKGNAVKDFQIQDIKRIPLFSCPLNLQEEFANFIKHTDKLKVEVQTSLNETQMLFNSLMQTYFE